MIGADSTIAALQADLAAALPHWELSARADVTLLSHSENTTFLARDAGRALVLRVQRIGYHAPVEIHSELAWIAALIAGRVAETPCPRRDREGLLLRAFPLNGVIRHVVAFEYMSGREPDPSASLPAWFRELGRITAQLHEHSRRWRRPDWFSRKVWDFDAMLGTRPLWGDWRAAAGLGAAETDLLHNVARELERRLRIYGMDADRFGLVHADLRLANLLVEDARLGIIDFDDCGFSWFFYDFAAAVSFIEDRPIISELEAAWLDGYRTVKSVPAEDENMLPTFVMLRRMLLTAWIASHAETQTARALGEDFARTTADMGERFLSGAM